MAFVKVIPGNNPWENLQTFLSQDLEKKESESGYNFVVDPKITLMWKMSPNTCMCVICILMKTHKISTTEQIKSWNRSQSAMCVEIVDDEGLHRQVGIFQNFHKNN